MTIRTGGRFSTSRILTTRGDAAIQRSMTTRWGRSSTLAQIQAWVAGVPITRATSLCQLRSSKISSSTAISSLTPSISIASYPYTDKSRILMVVPMVKSSFTSVKPCLRVKYPRLDARTQQLLLTQWQFTRMQLEIATNSQEQMSKETLYTMLKTPLITPVLTLTISIAMPPTHSLSKCNA